MSVLYIQNKWSFATIIYVLLSIFFLVYINYIRESSYFVLSIFYVLVQVLAIVFVWNLSRKKLGIFVLFQLTYSLFIGGRFFSYLLDVESNYDIFQPSFFFEYYVDLDRKLETYSYALYFVIFSVLGYSLTRNNCRIRPILNIEINDDLKRRIENIGKILFPFFCVYLLYDTISMYRVAVGGGGYTSLYADQVNDYSSFGGSFIPNLILFFFAYSFTYSNRKMQYGYLMLYLLNSMIRLMIGTRGGIGALFLLIIWIYSFTHKISLKKLCFFVFFSLFLLLYLFSFSVRTADAGTSFTFSALLELISNFIYSNGGTLMVFDVSRLIDDYPIVAYFQTFIPGSTFVGGLLGNSLAPQDCSFAAHMCYELNPALFLSGFGLGWSILCDIYLFSYNSLLLYILLSLGIGILVGLLESFSERYRLYKYITFYIFTTVMLIPRGGLLVPLLIYGVFYIIFFRLLFSLRRPYL